MGKTKISKSNSKHSGLPEHAHNLTDCFWSLIYDTGRYTSASDCSGALDRRFSYLEKCFSPERLLL